MEARSATDVTPQAATHHTTNQLLALLGLGGYWAGPLESALRDHGAATSTAGWALEDVRAWKRQALAQLHQMGTRHLRSVALRSMPVSLAQIEVRAHVNATQASIDRWGLTLSLAYTHDLLPMHPGRAGDRLRRTGLPHPSDVPSVLRAEVIRMWEAGASRADIRAAFAISEAVLSKALMVATPRLGSSQVSAGFGWSPDNVNQKLRRGTFPAPDGVEGALRWWWPSTVQRWEDETALTTCPTCGAKVQRLRQHQFAHAN